MPFPTSSWLAAAVAAVALGLLPGLASADAASDLTAALAAYPSLSSFRQIVSDVPGIINALVPDGGSDDDGSASSGSTNINVTVLAPSNGALSAYAAAHGGASLTNLSTSALTDILSYHILAAPLTSTNFTAPRGLTIPTLLIDKLYNNRTAGADLEAAYGTGGAAAGQVVYVKQQLQASVSKNKAARQSVGDDSVQLQAGLAQTANVTALDASWSLGYIHMVDV